MNIDDMVMVSIDDHVVEPADIFEKHFPKSLMEHAPKLTANPRNPKVQAWLFQDQVVGSSGLNAVVSWPKKEWGMDPTGYAEMRPGVYDMSMRVRDMDANGTLAATLFATFPGFAGTHLASLPDKKLSLAACKAFNDWVVGEVPTTHPGRFIPIGIIPFFDPEESVKEIHRLAAMGCRSISIPETPYGSGYPDFKSGYWDPMFKACVEHNIVLSLHIGGGFSLLKRPEGFNLDDMMVLTPLISTIAANDMLLSGAFQRFPDLKIAMSEGGVGWVAPWLDRVERHLDNQAEWLGSDFLPKGMTATDVWRKNFLACYITEPSGLSNRDRLGIDTIAWECDYPHSDSTWPHSPEVLKKELDEANCTDEEIDKITFGNVARFFDWDPFKHISREQATVGALRARATDVDTAVTSKEEYRRRYELEHTS
ncbi:amidohydrolase family protein [Nocardia sp. 348MFTsu5.1]|uniref:amidohydrolase family protein n=1 Tax=Nocardia sp. 348MFTsu5.1 TaxID=1172185 RepID=UPI0003A4D4FA|nr:amidohydrolase family protein [Nocardia sp. 348MFTsu5.1]